MTESEKYFILYTYYRTVLKSLSGEQVKTLLLAIFDYAQYGEEIETDDVAVRIAFWFITLQMDSDGIREVE